MALVDNKAKIQALLDGINALPDKDEGETAEPVLQEKSVTPTKEAQTITPDEDYDGLSQVNVGAIPDEYIIPSGTVDITENGTHDVREAESVSVNVPTPDPTLQEKTVTPSESTQTITPDTGYDGLSKVTMNPIPSGYIVPSGTKSITENGSHDVTEFASVEVAVESDPISLQEKTATPSTAAQEVTADSGYDGLSKVTVNGDSNLVAGNIKSGVSIFGVAGTLEEGSGGGSGVTSTNCTVTVKITNNLDYASHFYADVWYSTVTEDGSIEYAYEYIDLSSSKDAEFDYECAYGTYLVFTHNQCIENYSCTGCCEAFIADGVFSVEMELSQATVELTVTNAE